MKFAPDWRRILNELQRYSVNGAIDIGITNALDDKNYDENDAYLSNVVVLNFKLKEELTKIINSSGTNH